MTDDAYERYLDDFGAVLEQAAARTTGERHHPRPGLLVAGSIALGAAIAAAVSLAPGSAERLDVLAEARAALTPRAAVLHTVVRERLKVPPLPPGVSVTQEARTTEQWSATNPVRWRRIEHYPSRDGAGLTLDHEGRITGEVQYAYAPRTFTTYFARRHEVRVITGAGRSQGAGFVPGPTTLQDGDPDMALKAMLTQHAVTDAGSGSVGGRPVRRLVWTPADDGPARIFDRIEYDVDPTTFAPVAARLRTRHPIVAGRPDTRVTHVLRFLRFERLPATPANLRLLQVQPVGRPRVVRLSPAQLAALSRRAYRHGVLTPPPPRRR